MGEFASEDAAFIGKLVEAGVPLNVIYDIGASNGYWSIIAAKPISNGTYHLFEPQADSPAYSEKLDKNLRELGDATLHKIALSDKNAILDMTIADDGFSSSLHDVSGTPGYSSRRPVQCRRLDDYVAEKNLPPPSLVKMDTQGTEHLIVSGGKKTLASAHLLIIESWFYRGYNAGTPLLAEMIALLEPLGFVLTDFGEPYRAPSGRLVTLDAYFCSAEALKLIRFER